MGPIDNKTTWGEGLRRLQRVWDTVFATDVDLNSKLEELFSLETDEFRMESAFLSRIDREAETQRFNIVHNPGGSLEEGNTVPLSSTYCRETIKEPSGTMAVTDATAEGWADDSAYDRFGFESYLGTTVTAEDELYGTLCFADTSGRDTPITAAEESLVGMLGQWLSYELNQWKGPPTHGPTRDVSEGLRILSGDLDSMMKAIQRQPRRRVLFSLLNTPTTDMETLERQMDNDTTRLELYHIYLPKLAQNGYVQWDSDAQTVSRGPNFLEIEPLLQLLKEYFQ